MTDNRPDKGALWTWRTDADDPDLIVARVILDKGETHIRITERDVDAMKNALVIGRLPRD